MSEGTPTKVNRFRTWAALAAVAAAATAGMAAGKGDAQKGKTVFAQCAVCHLADSDQKKIGPGLKGLFKRDKMANGKKPTEANIRAKLDEGGSGMPPYKDILSDAEKDDLLAYLKTL